MFDSWCNPWRTRLSRGTLLLVLLGSACRPAGSESPSAPEGTNKSEGTLEELLAPVVRLTEVTPLEPSAQCEHAPAFLRGRLQQALADQQWPQIDGDATAGRTGFSLRPDAGIVVAVDAPLVEMWRLEDGRWWGFVRRRRILTCLLLPDERVAPVAALIESAWTGLRNEVRTTRDGSGIRFDRWGATGHHVTVVERHVCEPPGDGLRVIQQVEALAGTPSRPDGICSRFSAASAGPG